MSSGDPSEKGVFKHSETPISQPGYNNAAGPSRRTSLTVSSRPARRSSSPSRGSKAPLTPEKSPLFKATRKRSASVAQEDHQELNGAAATPLHSRANSNEAGIQVCICQPDPKIPRPRNAFILYRQHHQANVVAQNPGLANPEISKVIGEQWQNQPPEVKNKWKGLAEEEKLRHQQQYPTYRYQPKRNGRRNSLSSDQPASAGEKPRCAKCGGRTILTPSTPYASSPWNGASPSSAVPPTPRSAATTITRTLPALQDMSLSSPAARGMGGPFSHSKMPSYYYDFPEERDNLGPLSPDNKRRRHNGDYPPTINRTMPPRRKGAMAGPSNSPATPFPFAQASSPQPYPLPAMYGRRESLPSLRGIVSPPGPMAPPPRPGMGYQQHRMSQGHLPHDRSLILPPLQTGSVSGPSGAKATAIASKTAEEQIMSLSFRYKIKILGQVANPAPIDKSAPRGPLVAIEGDDADAVTELGRWLCEELRKGDDLSVQLLDGPDVSANTAEKPMVQVHLLAAEWQAKSDDILASIAHKPAVTSDHSAKEDATPAANGHKSAREIEENYDDSDDSSREASDKRADAVKKSTTADDGEMDIDKTPTSTTKPVISAKSTKPVSLIANFSLYASNVFACRIPVGPHDPYSPSDHWQWTATQWRGVVGPDLTIFLRDSIDSETGKPTVEMLEEGNLFVVKRTRGEGDKGLELEGPALRRLGFEVSEWVRAFGSEKKGGA